MSFTSSMGGFKKSLEEFSRVRRQFLVDPEFAARDFCAASKEDLNCSLGINIRVAGFWDDICKHPEASTFYTERYYLLSVHCRLSLLKIYDRELPTVNSLIKR